MQRVATCHRPGLAAALHMPSHIFTRVGAWQDAVSVNRRSADVAKKTGNGNEAYHAADYMVYAQLQLARDKAARNVLEEFRREVRTNPAVFVGPYAAVAMPARLALERGDWPAAARLEPQNTQFPFCDAITTSRAQSARPNGDAVAAGREAQVLEAQHRALVEARNLYLATEVEIHRLAAGAWIAHARVRRCRGDAPHAASRRPRDRTRSTSSSRPSRAGARAARDCCSSKGVVSGPRGVRASQVREPNRLRGFVGPPQRQRPPRPKKARHHHSRLIELTREADTPLPEVARAKRYLAAL